MNHEYQSTYKRVILKPLSLADAEKMRQIRNQNRTRFFDAKEISAESQQKWYNHYIAAKNDYMFSVYLKDPDVWVGAVGIYHVDLQEKSAEFGRLLIHSENIRGLGLDATLAACKFAFEQLKIKKIYLEVYANNISAIRTYERAGFQLCENRSTENSVSILYMEKYNNE